MATDKNKAVDRNEDPISGEPGAHPVGAGVGAAAGGAAAGMAAGMAAGPVGTVVGAVAGGIVGGLVGKGVAEAIDPTVEDQFWEKNYRGRPYVESGRNYNDYRPAYRYGVESFGRHGGKNFDQVEPELRTGWE